MEHNYSLSLIALLKGIVYNHQKEVWDNLLHYEPDIKKYFVPIGLELFLDKSEGYAFLRQKEWEEDELQLPKLTFPERYYYFNFQEFGSNLPGRKK
jgi:hypothetical protein